MKTDVADIVTMLLAVNVGAMLLLAVMAYVSSVLVLDGLESLDRWLDASQRKGNGNFTLKKTPIPPLDPALTSRGGNLP